MDENLAAAEVRSRIGWLAQATHLFDDTIRANLKSARPDADDAALWGALDAARIGEMVRALPDGLDTWVGELRYGSRYAKYVEWYQKWLHKDPPPQRPYDFNKY